VLAGETLQAEVDARYFFDAPAGNVPVTWALYARRSFFSLPGYQVGREDTSWLNLYRFPFAVDQGLGIQMLNGEATTGADGRLTLDVPTRYVVHNGEAENLAVDPTQRQRLTLEVTLQDESGRPVSARAEVVANPAEFYIGVRPDAWVGQANQESGFDVQVADWNQNPAGVQSLRAEFRGRLGARTRRSYRAPNTWYPGERHRLLDNEQTSAWPSCPSRAPTSWRFPAVGHARTHFVGGRPRTGCLASLPNQRLRLVADGRLRASRRLRANPFGTPWPC
jgi:uncharacterized protein YfaS (alpha-2-macroglobulin family)